jgi:hypothetical protein
VHCYVHDDDECVAVEPTDFCDIDGITNHCTDMLAREPNGCEWYATMADSNGTKTCVEDLQIGGGVAKRLLPGDDKQFVTEERALEAACELRIVPSPATCKIAQNHTGETAPESACKCGGMCRGATPRPEIRAAGGDTLALVKQIRRERELAAAGPVGGINRSLKMNNFTNEDAKPVPFAWLKNQPLIAEATVGVSIAVTTEELETASDLRSLAVAKRKSAKAAFNAVLSVKSIEAGLCSLLSRKNDGVENEVVGAGGAVDSNRASR